MGQFASITIIYMGLFWTLNFFWNPVLLDHSEKGFLMVGHFTNIMSYWFSPDKCWLLWIFHEFFDLGIRLLLAKIFSCPEPGG